MTTYHVTTRIIFIAEHRELYGVSRRKLYGQTVNHALLFRLGWTTSAKLLLQIRPTILEYPSRKAVEMTKQIDTRTCNIPTNKQRNKCTIHSQHTCHSESGLRFVEIAFLQRNSNQLLASAQCTVE